MSYQLSTSVVKLDLNYILDNFFKPSLWKKTWTVFAYDKYEVKVNLSAIFPKNQNVYFDISLFNKGSIVKEKSISFNYDKGNRNLVAITNNFNGSIIRLIEEYEEILIKRTWAYKKAEEVNTVRAEAYRKAAKEKLEELESLSIPVIDQFIDEISEMYIDNQVSKAYDFTTQNEIITGNRGKILKSLYLSYMLYAEMNERREKFIKEVRYYAKPTSKMIGKILSELSRVKKIDFIDTIKDNLDEIKI